MAKDFLAAGLYIMVNFCMKSIVRKFLGLAAPPTALAKESDIMLIGQARERLSAIARGREMLSFLDQENYTVGIVDDMVKHSAGSHSYTGRLIKFNRKYATEDGITIGLPHEIFHAMQNANVISFANMQRFLLKNEAFRNFSSKKTPIKILDPRDLCYASNIIEMAAYGAGTDVVMRMEREAGDHNARDELLRRSWEHTGRAYERVVYGENKSSDCESGGYDGCIVCDKETLMRRYEALDVATTVASYDWFWNAKIPNGQTARWHYADQAVEGLFFDDEAYQQRKVVRNLAAQGKVEIVRLTAQDIRLFGKGFGYDVFGIPEFDDLNSSKYRREATEKNRVMLDSMSLDLKI